MKLTKDQKIQLKEIIKKCFINEDEIKKIRDIAKLMPLDIFPIRKNVKDHFFLKQILAGEVIYER